MGEFPEKPPPEWNLSEWESALTINVGTVYVCRECQNIVMVTRGGLGILELQCCGKLMDKVKPPESGEEQ